MADKDLTQFEWPNLEMLLLRVTQLPDPYQAAVDLNISIAEYQEWLNEAILRESAIRFDTLSISVEPTEYAPKNWGTLLELLTGEGE